ncbi:hypothetical protein [Lyngbya sp. PCC 8106]|uniref:hypothetical protein n=1 Tax=Lyngbya sp. (strain PCC 8106) TaxID=313612 RepID=UPI0000EAB72B|nr:hypothetical protein [Lyngbya sp. PCC 8106]EAW36634.1 hypothetical protein L8106_28691 [Lyngbya sp. PCC 8106]
MTGSLKGIEEDIASLEEAIFKLAQDFDGAYENYLTTLGNAMRQQLILANYHLCTQGYPEYFLKLSYSQRQKFQQSLQALAANAQKMLISLIQISPASQALEEKEPEPEEPELEKEDDADEYDPLQAFTSEDESLELSADLLLQPPTPKVLSLPERLAKWQDDLEKSINTLLRTLSRDTNFALQQANIFPHHLPEAVLEAASQAEASAETVASPPNLLNLMIETENLEEDEGVTNVTRLMAVHLRVSEIEFADATLMSARHKIRHLSAQLNKVGRSYQKKQRERAVLEAEAAWRSSWFEENPKD